MGKIRMRSTAFSDNPELKAPVFNFSRYVADGEHTYYNNGEQIDFVTDGSSLYVCLSHDGVTPTYENIEDQADFLKLVSQGPQGIRGPRGYDGDSAETPRLSAEFDNDQLRVYINGEVETVSPRLTGKSWRPKLEDNMLVWELSNKMYAPEPIDLEDLRPIQEKPLLLRVDSDNTKRTDEKSGPARFIQWKYEGDPHWTNLISISELMNLTLAGITIFPVENTETGKTEYHLGHKEVLEATYDSDKDGHRIISNVELGHVLFDAGPIPIGEGSNGDDNDFQTQIDLILAELAEIKTGLVKSVNTIGPNTSTGNVDLGKLVKTVNHETPDNYGNVQISLGNLVDLTPYVKKSDLATINNQIIYNGGNFNLNGQSVAGLQDIKFRVNSTTNKLEFSKKENGSWGEYSEILSLSSTTGGEHVELTIHDNKLWISYNNGAEQEVGSVGGSSSGGYNPNALVNASLNQNTNVLTFTKQNGNTINITLPSGSVDPTSGITESEVKSLIGRVLEGILDTAIPEYLKTPGHNYFIRVNDLSSALNGYATQQWVLEQLAGSGGDDPITIATYRTFTIYTWYSVEASPATPVLPTSASWDISTNTLNLVGNTNNWTDHPGNRPNDSTRLWMATISLKSDGTSSNDWSGPIDLTAYPGKDGNGIEFIYTLCVDETEFKALSTPAAQYQDDRDDDYPSGWTDQPQSIGRYSAADEIITHHTFTGNEEVLFRIEAASIRTSTNGHWSAYCKPFIWSMWGEDGMDGDGIEYIFFLADENKVTESNNKYFLKSNYLPSNSWGYEYQDPNSGWTDDPTGTSADYPYEFVSKRKLYEDPVTREPAKTNWSEPALWSVYKEGPVGPIGPSGVFITNQVRYYKANNQSTGVNAPAENLDPTLAANGGWVTNSNAITLTENTQYLWFFERITYSNQNIWQSIPVIIRYFNAGANVNYQEIEDAVEERLSDRLTQLSNRLDGVDHTYADVNITSEDALVEILADYVDSDNGNKSFAEIIVDGKGAEIAQAAGLVTSTQMTGVTQRLSAVEGSITNAVDQQTLEGAINSSEQRMTSNLISQTVTAANSRWHKVVNSQDTYQNYSPGQNETVAAYNARMIADGWELVVMADKLSAIEQKADKVSILVGEQGNVKADVIVSAINGGTVKVDANHIILNGQVVAGSLETYFADIQNANIDGLHATNVNVEGHVHATSGSFDYLTVNGTAVGTGNSLGIRFGNAQTATTEANTIYFLYE